MFEKASMEPDRQNRPLLSDSPRLVEPASSFAPRKKVRHPRRRGNRPHAITEREQAREGPKPRQSAHELHLARSSEKAARLRRIKLFPDKRSEWLQAAPRRPARARQKRRRRHDERPAGRSSSGDARSPLYTVLQHPSELIGLDGLYKVVIEPSLLRAPSICILAPSRHGYQSQVPAPRLLPQSLSDIVAIHLRKTD